MRHAVVCGTRQERGRNATLRCIGYGTAPAGSERTASRPLGSSQARWAHALNGSIAVKPCGGSGARQPEPPRDVHGGYCGTPHTTYMPSCLRRLRLNGFTGGRRPKPAPRPRPAQRFHSPLRRAATARSARDPLGFGCGALAAGAASSGRGSGSNTRCAPMRTKSGSDASVGGSHGVGGLAARCAAISGAPARSSCGLRQRATRRLTTRTRPDPSGAVADADCRLRAARRGCCAWRAPREPTCARRSGGRAAEAGVRTSERAARTARAGLATAAEPH